jgi:5'-3' exonuclease
MGVPGLFSLIIKEHNNEENEIIKKQIDNELLNHFYLDFNCALYTALYSDSGIKTEDTLIIHIIEYLEALCNVIPYLSFIYIAIDGCPPFAKVVQQKDRRYHSVCKKNRSNKINETFGTDIDKTKINNSIDTNIFTPGTSFMYNLSAAIKKAIKTNTIFQNKTILFSDSSIVGEGEHKILQHIKLAKHLAVDGTDSDKSLYGVEHNTIIYGLDGDLIFLSTILKIDNVYLFREANEYGNLASIHQGRKFLFMDITNMSNAIFNSFKKYNPSINKEMQHRFIDDFVFLCMILGNDFMPKNHWYSIYEGGMDTILSCYFQIYNHREIFLIDCISLQINTEFLCDIWFLIKGTEQNAICKLFEKRKRSKIYIKPDMSERERQQLLTDFYPLQPDKLCIEQAIEPTKPNWQARYYNICFNMEKTPENIAMICQAYLKTLVFNFLYYFDECPSWDWYYPYSYAPTFTDVYDELLKYKNINVTTTTNKIFHFKKSEPIDQQTLLFTVIPFASRSLIVKDAAHRLLDPKCPMNIYFPKKYSLNVAFHRYYHECTPIIYKMDMDKVKKFMKECKFTEDELRRNLPGEVFTARASVRGLQPLALPCMKET